MKIGLELPCAQDGSGCALTISNPAREKRNNMIAGSETIFDAERLICLINDQVS